MTPARLLNHHGGAEHTEGKQGQLRALRDCLITISAVSAGGEYVSTCQRWTHLGIATRRRTYKTAKPTAVG